MANPGGRNQFQGFGTEEPYGAKKRIDGLTKSAPLSGAPVPNEPERAQRRAVKGRSGEAAGPPSAPPPQPSYSAQLAAIYQELSALAPDDPNLAYYAAKAQSDPT